jgi:hypothetical protein
MAQGADEFTAKQNAPVWNELTAGQLGAHGCPAAQQVNVVPIRHGVRPAGQPHVPRLLSMQATPALQHLPPQGVFPAGQQHRSSGSEHVAPAGQQPEPHACRPFGQDGVTAVAAPKGLSTVAPTAAPAAIPRARSASLRLVVCASDRVRRSKDPTVAAGNVGTSTWTRAAGSSW